MVVFSDHSFRHNATGLGAMQQGEIFIFYKVNLANLTRDFQKIGFEHFNFVNLTHSEV
jgi:hypothetical protein